MEIRTYYVKKKKRRKTEDEIKKAQQRMDKIHRSIKINLASVGIKVAPFGEEMTEEEKAMNCLLYRFKRCNNYYNLLYTIYREDNSEVDFFNMCYMVLKEASDVTNFKDMYKALQKQLETETNVGRKQVQIQLFKKLSLENMKETGNEPQDNRHLIEKVDNEIDRLLLWDYIVNNCTDAQVKTIKDYLYYNKKIDSRAKRRLKEKLDKIDFKILLEK